MVTMAQNTANWRNTHTHIDHTRSLTNLHQHSLQPRCVKRKLIYYRIWNPFFMLKVSEGREGEKTGSTRRKNIGDSLPANWYHTLEKSNVPDGTQTLTLQHW